MLPLMRPPQFHVDPMASLFPQITQIGTGQGVVLHRTRTARHHMDSATSHQVLQVENNLKAKQRIYPMIIQDGIGVEEGLLPKRMHRHLMH